MPVPKLEFGINDPTIEEQLTSQEFRYVPHIVREFEAHRKSINQLYQSDVLDVRLARAAQIRLASIIRQHVADMNITF